MVKDYFTRYLTRRALPPLPQDDLSAPQPGMKLAIVIPCLAEYDHVFATLASLNSGSRRLPEAEVILVVNHSRHAPRSIRENNFKILRDPRLVEDRGLSVIVLDRATPGQELDPSLAGVGLARRIGMDQALRRLVQAGTQAQGIIACMDADTVVSPGYADRLLEAFDQEPQPMGGLCHFEHPWPRDSSMKEAIVYYELWLRYLEAGLAVSGSPFAFQSMGSAMVVSAQAYAMVDGMAPRQAAEDFHFLQKVAKISQPRPLLRISSATVYPMARFSQRVLFGTGRAMLASAEQGSQLYRQVPAPVLFLELQRFFRALVAGHQDLGHLRQAASGRLALFMEENRGWPVLAKLQKNFPGPDHFLAACHQWFDGLRIIRFLNRFSSQAQTDILSAWPELLRTQPTLTANLPAWSDAASLLVSLRQQWAAPALIKI